MKKFEINRENFGFHFKNLTEKEIDKNGISLKDIENLEYKINRAIKSIKDLREKGIAKGHNEKVLFTRLPYQSEEKPQLIERIKSYGERVRNKYKYVVSLGIGGSYLGNQVLIDALCHPYQTKKDIPKVFFAGNNVDPSSLQGLLDEINLEETMFIVISKSGTTMETMASFLYIFQKVNERGLKPENHFTVITDRKKGVLRKISKELNLQSFEVPEGIGGRWSVLSEVGLVLAATVGIDIEKLLNGAKKMDEITKNEDIFENPAYLYAIFSYLLYKEKGFNETVIMPYSDRLKSFSYWYVQLLSESLGKEKDRDGNIVNEGRTPIPALGTTDMHSQTQQHREGKYNKVITFIEIEDFGKSNITLPNENLFSEKLNFLNGKKFSTLLNTALHANEIALKNAKRPSCKIKISKLDEFTLGMLFYFFEIATAFEGELLNVNPYDQPGVEDYKKIMKEKLQNEG